MLFKKVGCLAALLLLSVLLKTAASYAQDLPSIQNFVAGPALSDAALSPSGRYLAFVQAGHTRGEITPDRLVVVDLENGASAPTVRSLGSARVITIEWASEDRILLRATADIENMIAGQRVISIAREGSDVVVLFEEGVRTGGFNFSASLIRASLPDDPEHVVMPAWLGRRLSLWRVNINTGETEWLERGSNWTVDWYTNADGEAVIRVDTTAGLTKLKYFIRRSDGSGWTLAHEVERQQLMQTNASWAWAGDAPNSDLIYVLATPGDRDTRAVYEFDLANGEYGDLVFGDPDVDVIGVSHDPHTLEPMAYHTAHHLLRSIFVDSRIDEHFQGVQSYFGDEVNVHLRGRAGSNMLLRTSGPQEPGSFYLYDLERTQITPLAELYPQLGSDALSRVEIVEYAARDGVQLSGYLTVPNSPAGNSTPLVVMPHGGPEARDYFGYDFQAQFLASRGYAVFQPNFRGSEGFGRAFVQAGYGQWHTGMADDITDGVTHLVDNGRVDPQRMCIVGASYGGYAALVGTVRTPDLYQCAVSISGLSDLVEFTRYWREAHFGTFEYLIRAVGHPSRQEESLIAGSPARRADEIGIPVLLIHGDRDFNVPVEQSQIAYDRLQAAGVDVRYEEFEGVDHYFEEQDDQAFKLYLIEQFLAEHLNGRTGPSIPRPE